MLIRRYGGWGGGEGNGGGGGGDSMINVSCSRGKKLPFLLDDSNLKYYICNKNLLFHPSYRLDLCHQHRPSFPDENNKYSSVNVRHMRSKDKIKQEKSFTRTNI